MNRALTRAFSKFAAKSASTPINGRRKRAPMLEIMENRQLLTAGTGYLSGTAFLDNNGNGQYTAGDTPLSNVTVELFQGTSATSSPIQTTRTDANGYYEFDNLSPGSYVVQEVAPTGYASSAAQANSTVNPASVVSGNMIQAQVVDPNSVYETYNGIESGLYAYAPVKINLGADQVNSFGPMSVNLGSTLGGTDLNGGQSFNTFCVNDLQNINFNGPANFQVTPTPANKLTSDPSVGGEIAYLYNHFGNSSLTNVTGPALQLAIWELLYDGNESSPDFYNGNFQLDGAMTTSGGATEAQIVDQATTFYKDALGQSESAVFLQTTNPTAANEQSMLAPGALNFGNVAQPQQPTAVINGQVFSQTPQGTNPQPLANVTITLDDSNGNVVATETTDSNGYYEFDNLAAGTYTVVESTVTGYTHVGQQAGTTGGTTGNQTITTTLTSNADSSANDFFETQTPAPSTDVISGQVFVIQSSHTCGQPSSQQQPLAGVTITLDDGNGNAVATATTDSNGYFEFDNLAAGTYTIVESTVSGYTHQGQQVGTTGGTTGNRTITTTLASKVNSSANDFFEVVNTSGCGNGGGSHGNGGGCGTGGDHGYGGGCGTGGDHGYSGDHGYGGGCGTVTTGGSHGYGGGCGTVTTGGSHGNGGGCGPIAPPTGGDHGNGGGCGPIAPPTGGSHGYGGGCGTVTTGGSHGYGGGCGTVTTGGSHGYGGGCGTVTTGSGCGSKQS